MWRIRPIKTPGKVFSYLLKNPSHSQLSVTYRLMGMMVFKQSASKLPCLETRQASFSVTTGRTGGVGDGQTGLLGSSTERCDGLEGGQGGIKEITVG